MKRSKLGFELIIGGGGALRPVYPPEWPGVKDHVLRRAKGQCERCTRRVGDTYRSRDRNNPQGWRFKVQGQLQVAHLDHDPRHTDPRRLQALCNTCHGLHDKRHHDGVGAVTSAMRGTLTRKRAELVLSRITAGLRETSALEPGEVEFLLAVLLSRAGRMLPLGEAQEVQRLAGGQVHRVSQLYAQLDIARQKLVIRGFACTEADVQVYLLGRPMWNAEQEEAV